MALTPAEKQHRYRERKERKLKAAPDLSPVDPAGFAAFLGDSNLLLYENLDFVGVHIDGSFEDEEHPIDRAAEWGTDINSLTRATAMVDVFIDAAAELAEKINAYKLGEIDRQLAGDISERDRKRLETIRSRLTRKTSHFFPVIQVKGA